MMYEVYEVNLKDDSERIIQEFRWFDDAVKFREKFAQRIKNTKKRVYYRKVQEDEKDKI